MLFNPEGLPCEVNPDLISWSQSKLSISSKPLRVIGNRMWIFLVILSNRRCSASCLQNIASITDLTALSPVGDPENAVIALDELFLSIANAYFQTFSRVSRKQIIQSYFHPVIMDIFVFQLVNFTNFRYFLVSLVQSWIILPPGVTHQ